MTTKRCNVHADSLGYIRTIIKCSGAAPPESILCTWSFVRNTCQAVFKESLKSPWLWTCSFCISSSPEAGLGVRQEVRAVNSVYLFISTCSTETTVSGSWSYANPGPEICLFVSWISLYSCYIFPPCWCWICVCVCVTFVSFGKNPHKHTHTHTHMHIIHINTQCDKHRLSAFVRDSVVVRRRERERERVKQGIDLCKWKCCVARW